ncbi:MAG: TonB-dependent receptor [Verrucomicrobiota bacterium]
MIYPLLLALFLSELPESADSPEEGTQKIVEFPEYTVGVTRTESLLSDVPFSASVVDQTIIQEGSLQIALDEPLQNVPGVFVLNPYNYAQDTRIAIRGFGARANFGIRGIKLFVDGIPATTPDGQGEVDGIDLGSAERIEILRGPSSALYGSSAGGVLLIETESAPENPTVESRITVGSYGLFQIQGKAGARGKNLEGLASSSYLNYKGYRQNSRTEGTKFNSRWKYSFNERNTLSVILNAIDLPRQDDPGGLTLSEAEEDPRQARERNILFDSGEEVSQERIGARWIHNFDEQTNLSFRAYYTHRDFANRLPFEDGGQVTLDRNVPGGGILFQKDSGSLQVSAGADYDYQNDRRKNFDNLEGTRGDLVLDQKETVDSLGIFIAPEYRISEAWNVSAALRYDRVDFQVKDDFAADGDDSGDRTFDQISPMIGTVWTPAESFSLFANVSQSFETPTTTELDNPDGGGFNPDLEPQTATNFELGTRGRWTEVVVPFRYEIALFHIAIDDALVPFEEEAFPGREFYRNAGRSSRTGLEVFAEALLTESLTLSGSYTWSDFRYDSYSVNGEDFSGNEIPGIPKNFGSAVLQYRSENGLFLRWSTRLIGSYFADDSNQTKVSSYSTSDLRLGFEKSWNNWTLSPFIVINNIFDEEYFGNIRINAFGGRFYEPAPDRNFYGGLRVSFAFE